MAVASGTAMITSTIMPTEFAWLVELTSWLSPSYPVGAFGFSHGLEWAVEGGQVTDRATLGDYITTSLEAGGGWTDLVLAAASWRAVADRDDAGLDELAELAAALRGTSELALETTSQGPAFVAATCAAWPGTGLDALAVRWGAAIAYPVAVGAACSGRIPLDAVLVAYGHAFASTLISAGIRLIPLGQTDGQRVLAASGPRICAAAARAASTPVDELGTAAPRIDLASMRHETQYTRLFRS